MTIFELWLNTYHIYLWLWQQSSVLKLEANSTCAIPITLFLVSLCLKVSLTNYSRQQVLPCCFLQNAPKVQLQNCNIWLQKDGKLELVLARCESNSYRVQQKLINWRGNNNVYDWTKKKHNVLCNLQWNLTKSKENFFFFKKETKTCFLLLSEQIHRRQ